MIVDNFHPGVIFGNRNGWPWNYSDLHVIIHKRNDWSWKNFNFVEFLNRNDRSWNFSNLDVNFLNCNEWSWKESNLQVIFLICNEWLWQHFHCWHHHINFNINTQFVQTGLTVQKTFSAWPWRYCSCPQFCTKEFLKALNKLRTLQFLEKLCQTLKNSYSDNLC